MNTATSSRLPRGNGFAAASLLPRDSAGRILRPAVEYSVVDHCNLRCAGCDHAAPHLPIHFADPNDFSADMKALAALMHVKVLRLLGGEPLLHPQLDVFVQAARESGIADQIALWTNGLLLHKAPRALLLIFDIVHLSVYPGVHLQTDLVQLARDFRTNGRKLKIARVNKFLHQVLNIPIGDPSQVRRTFVRCKETHVWSCHTVREGRYYKCAKPGLLKLRLAERGVNLPDPPQDGVALHGNPRGGEELESYLLSTEPLEACKWCLGTDGNSFAHHQLDAAALARERNTNTDWRALKAHPAKQLFRDLRDAAHRPVASGTAEPQIF
jgi:hypothetical protein